MKTKMPLPLTSCRLVAVTLAVLLSAHSARSASNTWSAVTDGGWANPANWAGGVIVPGAIGATTNTDTATFNTATGVTVTVDADRNLQNILFNTNAGSFTLSGGNLVLTATGSTGILATASAAARTISVDTPITLAGNYAFFNSSSNPSSVIHFGNASTITTAATTGTTVLTLAGTNTGTNTISGIISDNGSGAVSLLKRDAGTWVLNGANTFSGGVTFNSAQPNGTLVLGHNSALGSGTLTVQNAVTIQSDGATDRVLGNAVNLSTSANLTIGAGGDLAFGALQLSGAGRTVTVNNERATFGSTGNDGTARTLTKNGAGAMVVTGSFQSGGSIITGGILAITGTYSSSGNMNLQGGVLGLNGTLARSLGSGASQVQWTGNGGFAAFGSNATWGNAANNLTVAIGGTAAPAALTWGAANFLAGGQTLILGSTISNGTVNFRNALNLAGATQTVQVARGANAPADGVDAILSGTISNGSLVKTGTGVLALTAANTYTGATTVNAGTLLINGSGASAVTVNNGGRLGGTGVVGNSVTINDGGVLAPGNSAGMLSMGDLTLTAAGSILALEISGTGAGAYDQINVAGAVNLDGNGQIQLTLESFTPAINDLFFVILNDGGDAISGTLFGLAQGAIFNAGGQAWQISYTGDSDAGLFTGGNDLVLMAVPEPQALMLLGAGAMAFIGFRRRRA